MGIAIKLQKFEVRVAWRNVTKLCRHAKLQTLGPKLARSLIALIVFIGAVLGIILALILAL